MAATNVYYVGTGKENKKVRCFKIVGKTYCLKVDSFENGIVNILPIYLITFNELAEIVSGLFAKNSNFKTTLFSAFECDENAIFKGITFSFNDVNIFITKETADVSKICELYNLSLEENDKKWEAYTKTQEYRVKRAKYLKIQTHKEKVRQEMLTAIKDVELEFANNEAEEKWKQWVKINSKDVYSILVVEYATQFAKYMQYLIQKHNKPLYLIADNASSIADTMGMSGFSYGLAINVLVHFWKHGNELRKWHNKYWGNEDADGVINPAIITIG